MAEKPEMSGSKQQANLNPNRRYVVNAQYVKDVSFENPKAPASLFGVKDKPSIDLSVDIKSQKLQDNVYESSLHITAKASVPDMTLFLADVTYAGIIALTKELDKDALQELLLIECPGLLFPFARSIVADMVRDGGFPPLMLEPVDFKALFDNRNQQSAPEAAVAH